MWAIWLKAITAKSFGIKIIEGWAFHHSIASIRKLQYYHSSVVQWNNFDKFSFIFLINHNINIGSSTKRKMNIFQTKKPKEKENNLLNRMRTNEIRLYFLACASNKGKQNVRRFIIPILLFGDFLQFLYKISKNVSSFIFDFDYLDKLNAILEHRLVFVGILKFLLWVTFESVDVDSSIQFYSLKNLWMTFIHFWCTHIPFMTAISYDICSFFVVCIFKQKKNNE